MLPADALVADSHDDVPGPDPRLGGRPARLAFDDVRAVVDRQIVLGREVGRDRLIADADARVGHLPILDQLIGDPRHVVGRNGEKESLHRGHPGLRNTERVDPDDPAGQVEERPAGVAGVDRGVVLDEIGIDPFPAARRGRPGNRD